MPEQNLDTWKTKKEAAEFLSVSEKTVERLARERKKIAWAIRRRGGKRPEVVYNPEDLASVKKEQEALQPTIVTESVSSSRGRSTEGGSSSATRSQSTTEVPLYDPHQSSELTLERHASHDRQQSTLSVLSELSAVFNKQGSVSLTEKLCLTIVEASALSGLTQSYIRRQIKDGHLPAFQDRGWKIRRSDLTHHIDTKDTRDTM